MDNNSDFSALLTVESAYSDKCGFVGFRLTSEKETLLVFASRFNSGVEGFRVNDKFTPGIGEKISYVVEKIGPKKAAQEEGDDTFTPRWGGICLLTGMWHPNHNLKMSPEDQREHMVRIGDICKCGHTPITCRCEEPK
jgi:hypothetical protein